MDEGSVNAPSTEDGKTSDQLLAEIEAAQAESAKAPEPADKSQDKSDQVPSEETDKQVRKAEDSEAAEQDAPTGKVETSGKVDIDEWMKKKGFKTVQDMAKSLRNLEQELSKRAGKSLDETIPARPDPVVTTQSRFVPQVNNLAELAEQYETDPDSFRRVMRIVNDAADLKLRMALAPRDQVINQLQSELKRERANKELESDPHFKNRLVMQEAYQIMESDPSIQSDPEPLKAAFNKALQNLGRRFVEGVGANESNQEQRSELPKNPPPMGKSGQGRGAGMKPIAGKMTPEKFNSLSSADMEKYLAQQGMVRNETF